MTRPGQPPGPDSFDTAWPTVHDAVDILGPWRAIWTARTEPDAHARRCAADAIDAIDTAISGLHAIRARWVTEIRQADDQAAARADQLLAQTRDGPPGHAPGDHRQEPHTTSPRSQAPAEAIIGRGGDSGPSTARGDTVNPLTPARDRFERDLRQQIRTDTGPGSSVAWSYLHLIELAGEFPDLPARALVQRAVAWYGYAEAGRRADGGDP